MTPPNGSLNQFVSQIATDASGVYVVGYTNSATFPVTSGVVQPTYPGGPEGLGAVFVSKLDPTGQLIFSTYLAGFQPPPQSGPPPVQVTIPNVGVTVDSSGDVYIAGNTGSGLPIPSGSQAFQSALKGLENVGIVKLNSTGTAILAGTYLGGSNIEYIGGLAVDSSEDVYVSGTTKSPDFPLKTPLQNSLGTSGSSGFATELNPALSGVVYSTYFGANSLVGTTDRGAYQIAVDSLAIDSAGDAYILGVAMTPGFPTTPGAYQSTCEYGGCNFVIELGAGGSAILSSTYTGALQPALTIGVDNAGNVYLAGVTNQPTFPVVNPIQSCSALTTGGTSADFYGNFVSEFNSTGVLAFSTCLGNMSQAGLLSPAMTLDSSGNVYLAGSSGQGIPLQNGIDANPPNANYSCSEEMQREFVSEISSTHTIVFSSYVAGPTSACSTLNIGEGVNSIAVDPSGNIYLAGQTQIPVLDSLVPTYSSLPVFNAIQSYFSNAGCNNCYVQSGFIEEISPAAGDAAALAPAELVFPSAVVGSTSAAQTTTIFDLGTSSLTVSNVAISGDFAIASNPCSTVGASGGSCAIQVTFTPTATGTRNGTLTITDSSAGSPREVVLTGIGTPSSLTFSSQTVGTTSAAQTVALTAGGSPLQELAIQQSGDFSETNNCGTSLRAFGTCQLQVTFTPTAGGSRSGTVTITDNASNGPQTISLTGTGIESIGLAIAQGGSASATVSAGSSATYSLSIGGQGMSGTASLACTGAPMGATCSVPATMSVSATNATTFAASVTTTSGGEEVPGFQGFRSSPWLWAITAMALVIIRRRQPRWRSARACLVCFLFSAAVGLSSCGGGNGNSKSNGTPTGTYKLNVTAQIGSTSQSTTLTLTVQ
jgi:hypothetical protein